MLMGIDVNMSSFGMDQFGGVGLLGYYDVYWGSCIGVVLMISLFSDVFKYEVVEYGLIMIIVGNGFVM